MTFERVLEDLKEGKRAYRRSWVGSKPSTETVGGYTTASYIYVEYHNGYPIFKLRAEDGQDTQYTIQTTDIFAYDWEAVC